MLYDMTFAQILSMVQVRNERERKAYEAAERDAQLHQQNPGYTAPPKDLLAPENLPSVDEVMRAFGGGLM